MSSKHSHTRPRTVSSTPPDTAQLMDTAVALLERANVSILSGASAQPAKMLPISDELLQYILNNRSPQKAKSHDLTPGAPLQPYAGTIPTMGPRQYAYQIGSNLTGVDRTDGDPNQPTFPMLRSLAQLYSGIGMCERVILDMVPRLIPQIKLKPHMVAAGHKESEFIKPIGRYLKWFEKPDRQHDIHSWLKMAYLETTQIDALSIYKAPNRAGGLYGLEIVDGTTIKPLIDERGRRPAPPYYAFQQYVYGIPGPLFTSDQIVYHRETPRANSVYGNPRVARIIIEVNQALRKKRLDLARFTEGNMPQGIMQVPPGAGWTPDMIDAYEQAWNSLLAGNEQQQARVKFTQPGFVFTKLDPDDIMTPFDMLLLNITVGTYGLSMSDLGFTEDIHKTSDEGQQNMMFRRTLYPFVATFAGLFTSILETDFHEDRFYFTFGGFEEYEDIKQQADAYVELIQYGVISPATVARIMKYPDVPETGSFLYTKTGQPLFMQSYELGSESRKMFDDQFMQLSAAAVQGVNPQETGLPTGKPPENAPNPNKPMQPKNAEKGNAPAKKDAAPAEKASERESVGTDWQWMSENRAEWETGYKTEMRNLRSRALADMKAGRPLRPFFPHYIPPTDYERLDEDIRRCQSADQVRALFSLVKEGGIAALEEVESISA